MSSFLAEHWPIVALLAVTAVALGLLRALVGRDGPAYELNLPADERRLRLLALLTRASEGRRLVLPGGEAEEIVRVRASAGRNDRRQRLAGRQIDALVCDLDSLRPLAVVRLVEESPPEDDPLPGVFREAGLALLTIRPEDLRVESLRSRMP